MDGGGNLLEKYATHLLYWLLSFATIPIIYQHRLCSRVYEKAFVWSMSCGAVSILMHTEFLSIHSQGIELSGAEETQWKPGLEKT